MKVLFVAQKLDRPEYGMIRGLKERGCDVQCLLVLESDYRDALVKNGIPVEEISLRGRYDRQAIRVIRAKLEAMGPDIVHCLRNNAPLANTLWATRGRQVKIVAYRGTVGNLHRWDPGSRLSYLHPRVDRICCVSHAVREYLLSMKVPARNVVTVHKGHDVDWYHPATKPERADYGLSADDFVVGCTANMRALKGIDVLLRAVELLAAELPKLRCVLIGEVRDRTLFDMAALEPLKSRVTFLGYQSNAAALVNLFDVFVMPSVRREGLPRAVIEAMAQRCPAIVSNVGGMPELVAHGRCGLVVPPSDAGALADAIRTLATNPDQLSIFGEQSHQRIQTVFHVSGSVAKVMDIYEDLCPPDRRMPGS